MPNGETGRNGWIHRQNDALTKVGFAVVIPLTAWILATVVNHSEELAARPEREEIASEQRKAEMERHAIDKKVERLDERTQSIQKSLHRQDQKLDTILDRLESRR